MLAADNGYTETVALLVKRGADIEAKNEVRLRARLGRLRDAIFEGFSCHSLEFVVMNLSFFYLTLN